MARRGLRWGTLGPPSASAGPPSACRLPPSVLSCGQAQSKSTLLHEYTALGHHCTFERKMSRSIPTLLLQSQTAVNSHELQLLFSQPGHTGMLLSSV